MRKARVKVAIWLGSGLLCCRTFVRIDRTRPSAQVRMQASQALVTCAAFKLVVVSIGAALALPSCSLMQDSQSA